MKRKIININDDKCDGCGQCIPDCPEGALLVIEGKARLVSDLFCDGLGACINTCPNSAMTIEEREAEPYSEKKVMANIVKYGELVIRAHLDHLKDHGEEKLYAQAVEYLKENKIKIREAEIKHEQPLPCGCPGSAAREISRENKPEHAEVHYVESELRQWPVQLKLLNPSASYFNNADLLVSADCVPFAYGNFHNAILKDKIVVMFCPKLDPYIDEYIEKMAAIFKNNRIKSVTIAHMEVPCCSGTLHVIEKALQQSGKKIPVKEITISVNGEIME